MADFLKVLRGHVILLHRMTEHIYNCITTGNAVTWIILKSGENENGLIFILSIILIKHNFCEACLFFSFKMFLELVPGEFSHVFLQTLIAFFVCGFNSFIIILITRRKKI